VDVLLENRIAVVHGGGGDVGGAVAKAFAREGARVYLTGRTSAPIEAVAAEIAAGGGTAETAILDALDEDAVDRFADELADRAGGIDVSFDATRHEAVHGTDLVDLASEDFAGPITAALRTQFLTARAAARHMVPAGRGVIMTITATTARQRLAQVGATGVTFDAIESLYRQLAAELGPSGVRAVWIQTTGLPEAIEYPGPFPDYGTGSPMTKDELVAWMAGLTMLGRLTTLDEVGNAALFLASDLSNGMTGASVNITCGAVPAR
jgi:NAD(P)-dependent dehydrogenase (short-subunit alcohol dehydrogenase family)